MQQAQQRQNPGKNTYYDISALYHGELNSNTLTDSVINEAAQEPPEEPIHATSDSDNDEDDDDSDYDDPSNHKKKFFFLRMKRTVMTLTRRIHLVTNQVSKQLLGLIAKMQQNRFGIMKKKTIMTLKFTQEKKPLATITQIMTLQKQKRREKEKGNRRNKCLGSILDN